MDWRTPSLNSMGPGIMRSGFAPLVSPGVVCTLRLDAPSEPSAVAPILCPRCTLPPNASAEPTLQLLFIFRLWCRTAPL